MNDLSFSRTIVYVESISATLGFYEKVFDLKPSFCSECSYYGEVKTNGGGVLAFLDQKFIKEDLSKEFHFSSLVKNPLGFEICFTTKDVDAIYDKAVSKGAKSVLQPTEKYWGRVAYLRDLNGILIELLTPKSEK